MEMQNAEIEKKSFGPLSWEGVEGDRERLEKKFERSKYGLLAWREIKTELKNIFPEEEVEAMINGVSILDPRNYTVTLD